jgi:nitric oxide reductase NorD protein
MAEAEDVITDAARHATIFARELWRRHRPPSTRPAPLQLSDVAQRLDLLLAAVFGRSFALRVAQEPVPATWLQRFFVRHQLPPVRAAIPAADDESIWLPASFGIDEPEASALRRFRTIALLQAMHCVRGSASCLPSDDVPLLRDTYLLLEARATADALEKLLPGMATALAALRRDALRRRPPLTTFPEVHRPLEQLARSILYESAGAPLPLRALAGADPSRFALPAAPSLVLEQARMLCDTLAPTLDPHARPTHFLWRDWWTGALRRPASTARSDATHHTDEQNNHDGTPPRSAHLARRPDVRELKEDEDSEGQGAWMVQTAQPHEKAEDPVGMQRPTDRDASTAAEDYADALSELPEARLVSTPGKPKEILLSDEPPAPQSTRKPGQQPVATSEQLQYPEWDWRTGAYRVPGATVLLSQAPDGAQQWVDDTLAQHCGMLHEIRRRFELLRAQRVRLRRQLDGDDIDLDAYIESRADFCAGQPLTQRLYQSERRGRRDMAIMLLVDISGSTDGWISSWRRVIDVEREALLLVCIALDGMNEPFSVLAFSGEGPQAVVVRNIKRFDEPYGNAVAQRIAGLEPEHYTRAGAAIRHASSLLMREAAEHRLLLLLSDGKPNDIDDYEGRYGVEDMRQAVTEAKLQGIAPFCLTIDRQAANYLPAVFGPSHYALLPRPQLLPVVLLDWLRRLVMR